MRQVQQFLRRELQRIFVLASSLRFASAAASIERAVPMWAGQAVGRRRGTSSEQIVTADQRRA
jgi:hypothetical protein